MNNLFEAGVQGITNPWTWVALGVVGGLFLLGRTFLGRFQYTGMTPKDEEAEQKLRALHDEQDSTVEENPLFHTYSKSKGRKTHHQKLDALGEPRQTYKANAVGELVQSFGFDLEIDLDRQKLAVTDTRYPTMIKNRWELPLSFGNAPVEGWTAKLKQLRAYAERQAVKEGLKPKGKSRQRRVPAA